MKEEGEKALRESEDWLLAVLDASIDRIRFGVSVAQALSVNYWHRPGGCR